MEAEETVKWISRIIILIILLGLAGWVFRKLTKSTNGKWRFSHALMHSLKQRARLPLVLTTIALAAATLLPLAELNESTAELFQLGMKGVWIALAAWAASIATGVVSDLTQWKYDDTTEDNLGARQTYTKVKVLQRVLLVIIWIAATAGILMLFDQFRTLGSTLLASAGIASVVLGLSAQKTFGAMIAGIQVALSHPISIDDVVIVEGEWGRVEEITFTYVVVRIWDLRRLVLPVSYFLETPFQNWTKKSADLIGTVSIHVDYTAPVEAVREELERLCEEARPLWDGNTCVLQVTEAGAETMTLRALVSAANSSKAWDLRCFVREKLIAFLQANHPRCLPVRRLRLQDAESLERDTENEQERDAENEQERGQTRDGRSTLEQGWD